MAPSQSSPRRHANLPASNARMPDLRGTHLTNGSWVAANNRSARSWRCRLVAVSHRSDRPPVLRERWPVDSGCVAAYGWRSWRGSPAWAGRGFGCGRQRITVSVVAGGAGLWAVRAGAAFNRALDHRADHLRQSPRVAGRADSRFARGSGRNAAARRCPRMPQGNQASRPDVENRLFTNVVPKPRLALRGPNPFAHLPARILLERSCRSAPAHDSVDTNQCLNYRYEPVRSRRPSLGQGPPAREAGLRLLPGEVSLPEPSVSPLAGATLLGRVDRPADP